MNSPFITHREATIPLFLRKLLNRLLWIIVACIAIEQGCAEDSTKILAIGNSFSNNATAFLHEIAGAEGISLVIGRAAMGGASLERHMKCAEAFRANPADPKGRPYPGNFLPKRKGDSKKYSLQELLEAEAWQIVVIQQVSNLSYRYETFEPFAGDLIEFIRKHAPQAEIVIHQTWAYREDAPEFSSGEFTQEKMFDGLTDAYNKLAAHYKLRIIPVGYAFQTARHSDGWRFVFPDPNFDYTNPKQGTVPQQKGSLNKGWGWMENKDNQIEFALDSKHANVAGKYLAAQVWYEVLIGKRGGERPYYPPGLEAADGKTLRKIAETAVRNFSSEKAQTAQQSRVR